MMSLLFVWIPRCQDYMLLRREFNLLMAPIARIPISVFLCAVGFDILPFMAGCPQVMPILWPIESSSPQILWVRHDVSLIDKPAVPTAEGEVGSTLFSLGDQIKSVTQWHGARCLRRAWNVAGLKI